MAREHRTNHARSFSLALDMPMLHKVIRRYPNYASLPNQLEYISDEIAARTSAQLLIGL